MAPRGSTSSSPAAAAAAAAGAAADGTAPAPSTAAPADLTRLITLDEAAILGALKERFLGDAIYTFIGDILLAVNPYKTLSGVYGGDAVKRYASSSTPGGNPSSLPPHIYGFASGIYRSMRETMVDQSVIVSGESGAGKTESAKHILQCLSLLSGSEVSISKQIVAASQLLEYFGNAKTIRNRNSSRFGKFLFLKFNSRGNMVGANMTTYLLEKSRIVYRGDQERNYHIFYALLTGAGDGVKKRLQLQQPTQYNYLNSSALVAPDTDDTAHFASALELMGVLGFTDEEQDHILRLVAAVLAIGNVEFAATDANNDSPKVANPAALQTAADLLQVNPTTLESALTHRTTTTSATESFKIALSISQAADTRDALGKALYQALFEQLLRMINSAINIDPKFKEKLSLEGQSDGLCHVGVLDIFGFENFPQNSFEQLCINYANERLHQFFNHKLFRIEQHEYTTEGIDWKDIEFNDNQPTLDLLSKRPVGIFYLIDESCLLQQSTDDILLGKVRSESSTHDRFVKSTAKGAFTIMHYAAQVEYTVAGFIAKNQDSFHPDLLNMLQGSENSFTAKIFDADLLGTTGGTGGGIAGGALAGPDTPAAADSPTPVTTNGAGHGHSPSKSIRSSTHIRTASQDLKPSATTTAPVAPVPSASDKVAMLRRQPTLASSAPTTPSTTRNPIAKLASEAQIDTKRKGSIDVGSTGSPRTASPVVSSPTMTISAGSGGAPRKKAAIRTVGTQFKDSLESLMVTLENSEAHFVCCIKPNDQQAPDSYVDDTVLLQLKYLGITQTVRIRKEGYSLRMPFQQFWTKYWVVSPRQVGYHPKIKATNKHIATILGSLGFKEKVEFQTGKTKVFCKSNVHDTIDRLYVDKMSRMIVVVQAKIRMFLARVVYLRQRALMVVIQRRFRAYVKKRQFKARLKSFKEAIVKAENQRKQAEDIIKSREEALKSKQAEMEKIKAGLRSIDDQEKFVDPKTLRKFEMNIRLLSLMSKVPELKLRLLFKQAVKGLDRLAFIRFLPEITRVKPLHGVSLEEEQEMVIQALFNIFDKDHDGRVHLKDIIAVLAVVSYGDIEEKLALGFKLFDSDGYGDFTRDGLNRTMKGLCSLMAIAPVIPDKYLQVGPVRSNFLSVHLDNDLQEAHVGAVYVSVSVTSRMSVSDVVHDLIKRLHLDEDPAQFALFEIRINAGKIVFQRRMAQREKPIEALERWQACGCHQHMQFLLVRPAFVTSAEVKGAPDALRKAFAKKGTQLPFPINDNLGRGIVQVFSSAHNVNVTTKLGTAGRRSVQSYSYKSMPIEATVSAASIMETFNSKSRMAGQEGIPLSDMCLYEIRFNREQMVTYERPIKDNDKPLLLMAMTSNAEETAKFLIVERKEVLPEPTKEDLTSSVVRQVNVYLENPKSRPATPRPRAVVDFSLTKRLAVPIFWSTFELKRRIMDAVHVKDELENYVLHEIQTQNDKTVIYERILVDEERPLIRLRPKGRGSIDVLSAVPQFLLVKKQPLDELSGLMQPGNVVESIKSTAAEQANGDFHMSKEEENVQQDFADTFAEAAFADNESGCINQEGFMNTDEEAAWLIEYYTLASVFKRNKLLPFKSY